MNCVFFELFFLFLFFFKVCFERSVVGVQRQMSVVQVEHSETMERGKPKVGGLSDTRLGTIDRKLKCETCTANMAECPGHFGHLELAKPMFHIGFLKTVLSIMRSVCFNCSKILADEVSESLSYVLLVLSALVEFGIDSVCI